MAKDRPEIGEKPARQHNSGRVMALDLPRGRAFGGDAGLLRQVRREDRLRAQRAPAYAHDNAKLEAFSAFYNDLMLAPSGLSKLEREMIAVAVSAENRCFYCLTAHGAAVRQLSGDPALGELMVDELAGRRPLAPPRAPCWNSP